MRILWPVIIVVLVVGGVLIYSNRSESDKTSPETETNRAGTSAQTQTTETPAEASQAMTAGAYIDYSGSIIADTAGTKVLFFHAPWCPQCRALEASIKSSQIPNGVTIIKVDYDTNRQLRQKYGVTIQTTLVKVDDSGNLVEKYVAYDEPTFAAVKTNLL